MTSNNPLMAKRSQSGTASAVSEKTRKRPVPRQQPMTPAPQPEAADVPLMAPQPLFVMEGPEVQLGPDTFTVNMLPFGTIRKFQDWSRVHMTITSMVLPDNFESFGQMLVEGAAGMPERLRPLMSWALSPVPTDEQLNNAHGSQLEQAIDIFYDQSGLKWLAEITKNLAAETSALVRIGREQQAKNLARIILKAEEREALRRINQVITSTEEASTNSTESS